MHGRKKKHQIGTSVFAGISNNVHKTKIGKTSEEKGEGRPSYLLSISLPCGAAIPITLRLTGEM